MAPGKSSKPTSTPVCKNKKMTFVTDFPGTFFWSSTVLRKSVNIWSIKLPVTLAVLPVQGTGHRSVSVSKPVLA